MSRSNGQPEVIVNFADGFAYSKQKMEEAFRFLEKLTPTKPLVGGKSDSSPVKKEDVDLIVHEFEIPRAQAEKVLAENGGDLEKALRTLVISF